MTSKSLRTLITIFMAFVLAYVGLVYLFHERADRYAYLESEKQVLDLLLSHRAVHAYITKVQRPEIYRLKKENKLYQEYFSPKLMSFTYIARGIKDYLNLERKKNGLPEIYFKLASDNPRNPINQADTWESELLKQMNAGEVKEYREIKEKNGKKFLYVAIPINPSKKGCMVCHGDPADAPKELIEHYGKKAGFYEKVDVSRALISIRVPMDELLTNSKELVLVMSVVSFLILAAIFWLISHFILKLERNQQTIIQTNAELHRLSSVDYLTNICNRRSFTEALDRLIRIARRYQGTLSVMVLDLDHFKTINDKHGHSVGDTVLQEFSRVVESQVRESDLFGRWGGEEFIIAMPHQDLESALQAAEKVRSVVMEHQFSNDIRFTVSIGVSTLQNGLSREELIELADQALYRSKTKGRNRVTAAKTTNNM